MKEFVEAGGLMSYGPNIVALQERVVSEVQLDQAAQVRDGVEVDPQAAHAHQRSLAMGDLPLHPDDGVPGVEPDHNMRVFEAYARRLAGRGAP